MLNLAQKLRPQSLEDFVAQEHILSPRAPLYRMLKNNAFTHCFFWGAPGSGKTTLANLIAKELKKPFGAYNATTFKIEELRSFVKSYENSLYQPLIFIDEVHRLNKAQQEVLLPIMEAHSALIIGASTYNPYHSLSNAIRSRSLVFELKPLGEEHLETILHRALEFLATEGLGVSLDSEARAYLIHSSSGDARAMLHLLDAAAASLEATSPNEDTSPRHITQEILLSLRPFALHDGTSEAQTHYSLISAMIKSIRGSDVNASVYYLARLIAAGESPDFLARRLVILASEDIGNANPHALNLAVSTMQAVAKIGYPESRIILSQCAIYLASSPKSNTAYNAINKALGLIDEGVLLEVPHYIMPDSKHYLYPHNFGGYVEQAYLTKPLELVEKTTKGFEKTLNEWLGKITEAHNAHTHATSDSEISESSAQDLQDKQASQDKQAPRASHSGQTPQQPNGSEK